MPKAAWVPYGAAHLADGHPRPHLPEALLVPGDLHRPDREPQAVGRRHRELAVRPAGRDQVLRRIGLLQQDELEPVELVLEDVHGILQLERESGVQDVVRRRAVVDPLPWRAALFGVGEHDGHHVVADLVLDLPDPFDIDFVDAGSNRLRVLLRDQADGRFRPGQRRLDLQELLQLGLLGPDRLHLRRAVPELNGVNRHGNQSCEQVLLSLMNNKYLRKPQLPDIKQPGIQEGSKTPLIS